MPKKSYPNPFFEKYKDPRWQKKRLEILERDDWSCQLCGDGESMLAIHHVYYEKDTNPWDYPDDSLITLCEECHGAETHDRPIMEKLLIKSLRKTFMAQGMLTLSQGFEQFNRGCDSIGLIADIICYAINDDKAWSYVYDSYFASLRANKNESNNNN